jgi:glycerol-3-phosphate acyltransferase PlsX
MICHGGSSPKSIKNAILFAYEYAEKNVNNRLSEKLRENLAACVLQPESLKEQAAR